MVLALEEENRSHTGSLKAVILAGGKGTRARPFTDYFPKAMMPVHERPLISYIVDHLASFKSISELIIVADLKGLGGQIMHYLEDYDRKPISFVQDSSSGTAGDLLHLAPKLKGQPFVLWFADNLCALDVEKMYKYYTKKGSFACIATRQYRREETGFAKVRNGIITEFIEKPLIKMQNCECTGIYILSGKILDIIKKSKSKNLNLSYDVLQNLSKNNLVSSFDIGKTPWVDVESPIILERKSSDIKKIITQMS
ncbi:MAG: nucleotidyltransferase family protein [Candidatus Nitrosotenuis sp.]